jgi:3D (Asp-Asp-Asp) domain-containing protein/peptidoglycan hydrolase CwlO-like protein
VQSLRAQENALASRLQRATVDLYALDARLTTANAKLARLRTQSARLRVQQSELAQEIAATQRTLKLSQRNLSASLRLMYERGQTDPIAVILGAQSLDDVVTALDGIKRVTAQNSEFVVASVIAKHRLLTLRSELASHRARIAAAVRAANATERSLASASAGKAAFISGLRGQQQLKAAQIQELEATVRRAEAKSKTLTAQVAASDPVPALGSGPSPLPAPATGGRTLVVSSTGYSLPGHTATGLPVGWGIVAVDPTVIPLGTKLTIPGYGEGVAADVGGGIRGAMIDLWFPTVAQAYAWGRRTVTITLH